MNFSSKEKISHHDEEAYQASVLKEIAIELEYNGDLLSQAGVEITCFTSLSAGQGRKRKYPREVILVKYSGLTHEFSREHYPFYRNADSDAAEIFAEHQINGHDPYDLYFDAILNSLAKR